MGIPRDGVWVGIGYRYHCILIVATRQQVNRVELLLALRHGVGYYFVEREGNDVLQSPLA
jgi:hypothetical protein